MINLYEVTETNKMIEEENLDVRTITLGISLLDCVSDSLDEVCENIYNKITTKAKDLVATGDKIAAEFGIPVKYIGVGEKVEDLQKFDSDTFVNALFDVDNGSDEDR